MKTYQFTATDFECYPENPKTEGLRNVLVNLGAMEFQAVCKSPENSYQLVPAFDKSFKARLADLGYKPFDFKLGDGLKKEYDCAFTIGPSTVVFEIEKANWEKVFFDLLKCHMYLKFKAHFAIIVLPKNWVHKRGEKSLFDIMKLRYAQSLQFGMGTPVLFGRILFLGYTVNFNGVRFSSVMRNQIREECRTHFSSQQH
jgi:hypothetical protein